MKRSELRENIFKLLFRVEFNKEEDMLEQMNLYFDDIPLEGASVISGKSQDFIQEKYRQITNRLPEIDGKIEEAAEGWTIQRMGKVELTILRLALFEILFDDEVPTPVAINEAVELAKKFGGDDSPAFINGILGKIVNIK